MPLKNIITVPDPLLKSISKPVDKINDEIKILINKVKSPSTKMQLIFPSYRMLKA